MKISEKIKQDIKISKCVVDVENIGLSEEFVILNSLEKSLDLYKE